MAVIKITEEVEQLLGLLDAAFAYLNLIFPNNNEKQLAREATDALIEAWRAANLPITLKVHIMECHVCDFNDRYGTGDKEESFIKKGHQIGAKENSRYARLTNFVKKTESALNSRSQANHPLVVKQKAEVLGGTKRTRKKGEHNINKAEAKKIKREGYVKNFKMGNEN